MENGPFEDVFPIQDRDFPLLCLFTGGYVKKQLVTGFRMPFAKDDMLLPSFFPTSMGRKHNETPHFFGRRNSRKS